jgi:hypothetical protein
METLSNLPQATKAMLKGAQCCYLYLQVTTLADITNGARTHLVDWVTSPRYAQPPHHQANLIYPNQGHLSSTICNTFVHLLQLAFTKGTNNKLRHPLGNWPRLHIPILEHCLLHRRPQNILLQNCSPLICKNLRETTQWR